MSIFDLLAPKVAYASFDDFLKKVNGEIINPLILFLFALAILFFLWGMLQFLFNQDNEEAINTGKSHMIWGIIGIAIMMGVWTIMNIILNTFNITDIKIDSSQNEGSIEIELEP